MLLSSRNSLAIFLTLFALLALTLKDGADKYLVLHGYSVMEMVWFRFFVPFLGLLLLLPKRTVSALLAVDRWLLLRSLLFLVCALVSVIALAHVPLNVYTIICQLGSLAFVVAGVIFFRERLTRAKVAAVLLGLFGVLVVTHPDGSDANLYYLLPLVIVLANTGYNLITKLLDPRLTTLDILIVTCFMLGMVAMVALCWQPALWRFPALSGACRLALSAGAAGGDPALPILPYQGDAVCAGLNSGALLLFPDLFFYPLRLSDVW